MYADTYIYIDTIVLKHFITMILKTKFISNLTQSK